MISSIGWHVHNCCKIHGCKKGEPNCPVVLGNLNRDTKCPQCLEELIPSPNCEHRWRLLYVTHDTNAIIKDKMFCEICLMQIYINERETTWEILANLPIYPE